MVKETYYETMQELDYQWNQVAQAFWNRYPNPLSAHVLTEDTIHREIRDGKLYTRRLLSKTNPLPKWGQRFYNGKSVKIVEDSVIDPKAQTLTTYTRNIGFKKVMKVDEKVEYRESKNGTTTVIRSAWISSQVFGFSRAIRAFGVERFKSNCNKTIIGFNHVLFKMFPNQLNTIEQLHKLEQHPVQQQQFQQSKMNEIKNIVKSIYSFTKNQASKVYQIFSVKN